MGRVGGRGSLLDKVVGIDAEMADCIIVMGCWPGMVGCALVHPFSE